MKQNFLYTAFGLSFSSDFEIPELLESNKEPDIKIRFGNVPQKLEKIAQKGVRFQANKDEFLLHVDGVANYYIKNGNEIIIESRHEYINKEIRLFLLGSAFGALFIQRGLLPIHGSAVRFGDNACVFTGLSGVGKSSIAAYFVQNGNQILADDICVVNDHLMVEPGFPNMKIWKDVLKKLNIKTDSLSEIRPDIQKYKYSVDNQFCNKAKPINNIFIINTKNTPGFEYKELTGIEKFNSLKNNVFRNRFVRGLQMQQKQFTLLDKLLKQVNVYRVTRPQTPLLIKEFAEFLTNKFKLDE